MESILDKKMQEEGFSLFTYLYLPGLCGMDPYDKHLMEQVRSSGLEFRVEKDHGKDGIRHAQSLYVRTEDLEKVEELTSNNPYTGPAYFENLAQVIWG